MTVPVPEALEVAHGLWQAAGRPPPLSIWWDPTRWESLEARVLAELGSEPFGRETAVEWPRRVAVDDRDSQRDAFVVAMIWGYGSTSYGPYRTRRVIEQPAFADDLASLTTVALEDGGVQAYRHVYETRWGRGRNSAFLKHLGSAFGTKYLYFLTKAHDPERVTPILDDVAQRWFRVHAPEVDVSIGTRWTYPNRYETYVNTLHEWGGALHLPADTVEHLLFAQQQSRQGGQWSETWGDPRRVNPGHLLDQLSRAVSLRGLDDEAADPLNRLRSLLERADDGRETPSPL